MTDPVVATLTDEYRDRARTVVAGFLPHLGPVIDGFTRLYDLGEEVHAALDARIGGLDAVYGSPESDAFGDAFAELDRKLATLACANSVGEPADEAP